MQPARDPQRVGWCNDPLPDTNVYARFLYFVRFLAANDFYVIIDNHFNVDSLAMDQPDTWVRNFWTHLYTLVPSQCSWGEELCILVAAVLRPSQRH